MFALDYCDYSCYGRKQERIYRPNGLGLYLFLRFYTPMEVRLPHKTVIAQPGACLLYTPEFPQDYQALNQFKNNYVHFSVRTEDFTDYGLPHNEVFYPQKLTGIDHLFQKIQGEFLSQAGLKKEMLDALLRQLFIETKRQLQEPDVTEELGALQTAFKQLRFTLLTECERDWSITELCQQVHLEKSQFYLYYERFFAISPKADLLNARITQAKQLLANQAAQIQEVAESCGFDSASHFSRQFKRMVGCPPKEYQRTRLTGQRQSTD